MKIVNISGGLGNQMFHYAFALALKHRFPEEDIYIDTSHMNYIFCKKYKTANLHNGYELERIYKNLSLTKASACQLLKVTWYIPNFILSRIGRKYLPKRKTEYIQDKAMYFDYDENAFNKEGNVYYEGYWESAENYISLRDVIRKEYAHPTPNPENSALIEELKSDESVGIHVRRGDYLETKAFKGLCEIDYYTRAIEKILKDGKQHTFYIFSNDIEWCRDNLTPLIGNNEIRFVTHNTGKQSSWDMFLMSYCKDLIIANSSFSWWGAFLNNREGRVIAPKKWMNRDARFDIWLDEWIRL